MERDWNIVDDDERSAPGEEPPPTDEDRLDATRIARLVRQRRADDNARLWKLGLYALAVLAVAAVILWVTGLRR